MTQQKKICKECLVEKNYSDFSPNKRMTSGCINICRKCAIKIYQRKRIRKVYGLSIPRSLAIKKTKKQKQIAEYGVDVSQAIDALNEDYEDISCLVGVF